jgi:hypothetical protein
MWPYVGVDYNPPYLIVNSVVSYPPPLQRKRGGVEKISPLGGGHLYLSANFQNSQYEKGEYGKGVGNGWELTLCLWIYILWSIGNPPMPKLTLTQFLAGFNSHKMTLQLGCVSFFRDPFPFKKEK